jgi:hypothetical protein
MWWTAEGAGRVSNWLGGTWTPASAGLVLYGGREFIPPSPFSLSEVEGQGEPYPQARAVRFDFGALRRSLS